MITCDNFPSLCLEGINIFSTKQLNIVSTCTLWFEFIFDQKICETSLNLNHNIYIMAIELQAKIILLFTFRYRS